MRVLILAAGYGTRLYPITVNVPKALIPVGNKLLIDFIMDKVRSLGKKTAIEETIVVSNARFYTKFTEWRNNAKVNVTIINDGTKYPDERLGAIGDMHFVFKKRGDDDWLILGADNFFDWELYDFVEFASAKRPYLCVGVYGMANKSSLSNFGVVELRSDMRIKKFIEKPQHSIDAMVATCIYFFPRESLSVFNKFIEKGNNNDASGNYIEWLVKNHTAYGYVFKGKWLDIGHKDTLNELEVLINHAIKKPS